MTIWIDADACPVTVKEILYKTAERRKISTVLVANQPLRIPPSDFIRFIKVDAGFDVADGEIVKQMVPGDLVITADIPLAAEIIEKEGLALNPRGELYTSDSIRAKLGMRDFMDTLRSGGVVTGGPPPLNKRDRKKFADALDRLLQQSKKGEIPQ
jgi:uncharacterized protein YaiI (UPF0178 family)